MTTQDTENQAGSHEPSAEEVAAKVAAQNAEATGNGSTSTDTASTDASVSTAAAGEIVDNDPLGVGAEAQGTKVDEQSIDEVKDGGSASTDEKRGVSDAA